ncbi:hypothetical protein GCM10027566_33970 [Arachidicoccus ginsenosidivorans]|uniref:OmpA family protein n=1 Tax=Arachidicoccus ginsenosidivorans TaxID=496057 RepID=A0A5B8VKV5_9BACT|nr:OmpA family protein [Arachidicoccus ginsenosidivorans]QEC71595.1 OmpA family protein [Arachidicoccus ginsenosidivorans]
MKSKQLLRICTLIIISIVSLLPAQAQQSKASFDTSLYPVGLSALYIGAQAGYLFSNKDIANDPAYYLTSGKFAELNLGWRAKNSWFGWQLNLGRLSIDRKLPSGQHGNTSLNGYDILQSSSPNWMWEKTTRDDRTFLFDQPTIDTASMTNFSSWYAMTGPQFWMGKKRLQASLSLNAGIGMTDYGYYFVQGHGTSMNTLQYDYYSKPNDQIAGPVDVAIEGNYNQYAMSKETFMASGSPTDFTSADLKSQSEINLMARGALGIEYFITPKVSVTANASYWYILAADLAGQQSFRGKLMYKGTWKEDFKPATPGEDPHLEPKTRTIIGVSELNYKRDFEKKNLGLLSASIGVKFWLGKRHKSRPIVKVIPAPVVTTKPIQNKDLLITVKDKPTGYALGSVTVTVFKDGQPFYTGITDVNGALPLIKDIPAGNYAIVGLLNGIKTTATELNSFDFKGEARVINCELLHNDPRFTLVGQTLNAKTDARIAHVKTTLNQNKGGENNFQVSDDNGEFRFQLQPNADYTVYAEQKGYFSNKEAVTTKGLDRSKTLYVDLRLALNELKQGAHFELKDIYYDFDKANIRTDAAIILDNVYRMLIDNPTISIELSSYTDSRGSDSYNMKLSQQRATSAVQYLVSKGISSTRLEARGYGETRPVNGCINGVPCSEDQHQANRRTEIKILKQ